MTDTSIDHGLHRAFRRNRSELSGSTLVLLAGLVALVAISDREARDVVALVGFAVLIAGLGLVALDAWVPLPRPGPRVVTHEGRGATVLRASARLGMAPALLAVGVNLMAISFLMAPSLESVASSQRRGGVVHLVIPLAPVLLAAALALLVRRDRVLLTPEGLTVRRFGRVRTLDWDAVRDVGPVLGDPGLRLRVEAADGSRLMVTTRPLSLTVWELCAVVRHLAATPGDRPLLGNEAALPLLDDLRRVTESCPSA